MNGTYQQQYLNQIGITVWSERELLSVEATPTDIKHVSEEKYVNSAQVNTSLQYVAWTTVLEIRCLK